MFPDVGFAAETSWVWRTFGVAAILGFAAVYVYGLIRMGQAESSAQVNRFGLALPGGARLIGRRDRGRHRLDALGMVVFIVAFAMCSLELAAALAIGVAGITVAVLVPLAMGVLEETWFLLLLIVLVGVATAVVRVLDQRGTEHQAMAKEMALVAERERVARDVHDVLGHSPDQLDRQGGAGPAAGRRRSRSGPRGLAQIQSLTRGARRDPGRRWPGCGLLDWAMSSPSAGAALADAGVSAQLPVDASIVDPRHRIVLAGAARGCHQRGAAQRCDLLHRRHRPVDGVGHRRRSGLLRPARGQRADEASASGSPPPGARSTSAPGHRAGNDRAGGSCEHPGAARRRPGSRPWGDGGVAVAGDGPGGGRRGRPG